MARGRGGSGGSGSSGSSSVCKFGDYPCHFTITELYGHVYTSLFSKGELYGQLIVYIIWSLVLIGLLYTSLRTKARLFQAAVTLFLANFIFLCVRFGLLLGEIDVPVGYRYEISIVISGILGWPLILIYAALSIAYLILDFLVSADAVETYKEEGAWSIGDHDFGLTMTPNQITGLKTTALGGDDGLSPFTSRGRCLFIYSVFRTIVSTHFILHNWSVITDLGKWNAFIAQYSNLDFLKKIIIPEGFLKGYRTTVNGFPVVQAVLEFLGVIIACTAITYLLVLRRRETLRVTGGQYIK
ncbi:unnamed protein product [Parascedosporium putredinis]|uniref:Uncharacterized protein n=1 Tax=Parascedosporium putredinis TaxID=1442378 RepID=A0A9P1M9E8_9PEZI|nr:unnamed protein product [Parascedosporium putredinis]CAI7991884.1 unnamed protein product [Parascedosporium putredinis]